MCYSFPSCFISAAVFSVAANVILPFTISHIAFLGADTSIRVLSLSLTTLFLYFHVSDLGDKYLS